MQKTIFDQEVVWKKSNSTYLVPTYMYLPTCTYYTCSYIHTYIHVHSNLHTYMYLHTYELTCTYILTYNVHTHIHVYLHTYIPTIHTHLIACACLHVHRVSFRKFVEGGCTPPSLRNETLCVHTCMYVHSYIHTYIHTYIHVHTYIHIYQCINKGGNIRRFVIMPYLRR